jgi:hypothetical protein
MARIPGIRGNACFTVGEARAHLLVDFAVPGSSAAATQDLVRGPGKQLFTRKVNSSAAAALFHLNGCSQLVIASHSKNLTFQNLKVSHYFSPAIWTLTG